MRARCAVLCRAHAYAAQTRAFWFGAKDKQGGNDAAAVAQQTSAADQERDAAKQQRDQNISIAFRRASNQDALEMLKKKSKYWKPQLELTAAAAAVPFGALPTTNFKSDAAPLPDVLLAQPAFVSLVFRDAFHDMNFAWARHIFECTEQAPPAAVSGVEQRRPPAPLFQVFALEGMVGRLLSNTLIRNTRDKLAQRWESEFAGAALKVAPPSSVNSDKIVAPPAAPVAASTSSSSAASSASTTAATSSSSTAVAAPTIIVPVPLRRAGAAQWAVSDARLLAHIGSIDDAFLARLDALNKLTCYVFLLDGAARVRWRACGAPTPAELEALPRVYAQLAREHTAVKAVQEKAAAAVAAGKRGGGGAR